MGVVKQIDIRNGLIIFTMTLLISKSLMQGCQKLIKNHTKALVFTTLDILEL